MVYAAAIMSHDPIVERVRTRAGRAAIQALRRVLTIAVAASFIGASCGQGMLSVMPGVVNDPKNTALRRAIIAYGTREICGQIMQSGVGIKLREEDPSTGRFFVGSCFMQDLASGNIFLQLAGDGYAWTNVSHRMAFESGGAVEYQPDFLMDGSSMYVYFRPKAVSATSFKLGLVEQPITAGLAALAPRITESVGQSVMKHELGRGFTVVRDDDGNVAFAVGLVEKGAPVRAPYARSKKSERVVLANERTEVHREQRDFAGPFRIESDGEALSLAVSVDGAPSIDLLVMPRPTGSPWLQQYTHVAALGPPSGPPMLDDTVAAGMIWRRSLSLPKGEYFLVFDHSASAGRSAPPPEDGSNIAATVSYAVEAGDPR